MENTDIKEELDLRLEELIESHVSSLRADFRRLIGELPVPTSSPEETTDGVEAHAEALAQLKRSVDEIHAAGGQREMAYRLLDAAALQAARAALFLTRGEMCVGFEARGFSQDNDPFDQLRVTPGEGDPLRNVMQEQETLHLNGSSLEASCLAGWLAESEARQVCLAPVVVGGQTVAVLFADSGPGTESGGIHPESIDILTSVASMFLERLRRPVPAAVTDTHGTAEATMPTTAASEPQTDDSQDMAAAPDPEPQTDDMDALAVSTPPEAADSGATQVLATGDPEPEPFDDLQATRTDEPLPTTFDASATVALSDLPEPVMEADAPADDMAAAPETEQVQDPEPEPVVEEDARRFARLLVSEIVLYNEAQVKTGQKNGDLLSRLKEPIQLSRQTYVERFGVQSISCFDEELLKTLAQGDPALLGMAGD